ncbi:MAG: signal transduction histidine kinase [Flammeovirgaceae bacterium]|jgi:two-component system NtrC family sensor kinase
MEDSGRGMNTETLSQIFEPFYTTKGEKHTGLGLSISRTIIEKHGGYINAESTEGAGTCFTISIPKENIGWEEPDSVGH